MRRTLRHQSAPAPRGRGRRTVAALAGAALLFGSATTAAMATGAGPEADEAELTEGLSLEDPTEATEGATPEDLTEEGSELTDPTPAPAEEATDGDDDSDLPGEDADLDADGEGDGDGATIGEASRPGDGDAEETLGLTEDSEDALLESDLDSLDEGAFGFSGSPAKLRADTGFVYIDDHLQDPAALNTNWSLALREYGAPATMALSTVGTDLGSGIKVDNSIIYRQATTGTNTNYATGGCYGQEGATGGSRCRASFNGAVDGPWLRLTNDYIGPGIGDPATGGSRGGSAGTALNNTVFDSDLGVVIEYDQRVYRTNDGTGGTRGGGDGIAVYLVDAAAPYNNLPGAKGAGLGYASAYASGTGFCTAYLGVSGGYLGVGFDVYGNFQKAENFNGPYGRGMTRPQAISYSAPWALATAANASGSPQSIGLRGSGQPRTSAAATATASPCSNNGQSVNNSMRAVYGQNASGIGGYYWLAGTHPLTASTTPTLTGAVIDNVKGQSQQYRHVRVTLTPDGDARNVKVEWTDKLNVSEDKCYHVVDGVEQVLTGATPATCLAADGYWARDRAKSYQYNEVFNADLDPAKSPHQAPLPAKFQLGLSAGTGDAVNFHEVRNLRVTSAVTLDIEKSAKFLGDDHAGEDFAGVATGRVGEQAQFQIALKNNGPSDLDPAYPATFTDPLAGIPFASDSVTWAATAGTGAEICKTWNVASDSCTEYATSVTGSGPITTSNPLRFYGPADTTNATVVFTGTVEAGTPAGEYVNTGTVAASLDGGPQDPVLSRDASATIRIVPELEVVKKWIVDDETYADGDQPDYVGNATLALNPNPDYKSGTATPVFGAQYPYSYERRGSTVTIGETLTGQDAACTYTAKITEVNGVTKDVALDNGFPHVLADSPNPHHVTITNTVVCQTLTLIKEVDNTWAGGLGSGPGDWELTAGIDGATPVFSAIKPSKGTDAENAKATETVRVPVGDYSLSEAWAGEGQDISDGYEQMSLTCEGGTVTKSSVNVADGANVTCTFVNTAKPGEGEWVKVDEAKVPLTGSEWEITSTDPDSDFKLVLPSDCGGVEDGTFCVGEDAENPGKFTLGNLPWGEYELAETKAPAGYQISEKSPWTFVIGPDREEDTFSLTWDGGQIVNEQVTPPTLPLTGGQGAAFFAILGGGLVLGAGGLVALSRRRRPAEQI